MAQRYIAINRGKDGFKNSDFTLGTSSSSGSDIELRFNDAVGITKKDLQIALEAFERVIPNKDVVTTPVL